MPGVQRPTAALGEPPTSRAAMSRSTRSDAVARVTPRPLAIRARVVGVGASTIARSTSERLCSRRLACWAAPVRAARAAPPRPEWRPAMRTARHPAGPDSLTR